MKGDDAIMRDYVLPENLNLPVNLFSSTSTLAEVGRQILLTADPKAKTALTHQARKRWDEQSTWSVGTAEAPR